VTHRRALLGLIVVAAVWGVSFSVIKTALRDLSPIVLLAVRFLGAAALAAPAFRGISRRELGPGLLIGLLFWGGFMFQTTGLVSTTPSRSAFITSLAVPLTPVVFLLVYRTRPAALTWIGVVIALAGLYLLTRPDAGGGINSGDLLTTGCAICFAGQIVAAGHFTRSIAPRHLLAIELAVTGGLSLIAVPLLETPRLHLTLSAIGALVFLITTAVATFWFQFKAQQVVSPGQTALVFSLEPVFAALTSFVLLGERLHGGQWIGAALILCALILPELRRAPLQPAE
jgi:drug/metabolite transporter (DMT)-like permease